MGEIFRENFFRFDWTILVLTIFTSICFGLSIKRYKELKRVLGEDVEGRKENYSRHEQINRQEEANETQIMRKRFSLVAWYGAFTNLITVFPVLGMMGTVLALLSTNLSGSSDEITNNFLVALTSTFWGAVGGFAFKIADCFLSPRIEHIDDRYHIGIQRRNLDSEGSAEEAEDETGQDIS